MFHRFIHITLFLLLSSICGCRSTPNEPVRQSAKGLNLPSGLYTGKLKLKGKLHANLFLSVVNGKNKGLNSIHWLALWRNPKDSDFEPVVKFSGVGLNAHPLTIKTESGLFTLSNPVKSDSGWYSNQTSAENSPLTYSWELSPLKVNNTEVEVAISEQDQLRGEQLINVMHSNESTADEALSDVRAQLAPSALNLEASSDVLSLKELCTEKPEILADKLAQLKSQRAKLTQQLDSIKQLSSEGRVVSLSRQLLKRDRDLLIKPTPTSINKTNTAVDLESELAAAREAARLRAELNSQKERIQRDFGDALYSE